MAEVLSKMLYLKRNSFSVMIVSIALLFVVFASPVFGQENHQTLGPATPTSALPIPFMDLFTAPSNYYGEHVRKTYSDPGYSYHVSCPKSDSLSSLASVLGSAAKIMMSAAVIVFLKVAAGKMMLLPLTVMLIAKAGLKAFLLWPMISKMMKYFKKKKKKGHKSRMIMDCSERIACVIQTASKDGWASHLGAAATFSMINDVEEDAPFAKVLLSVLAGDKIAQCMSLDCGSGVNIS
ncbi:uncharacterized protein LOC134791748 [Cydia splendana]|uniref:uncharacterized protein LOC134791748 n=1 Tax=Cydia splendana TaxID=1100963 RepID=UPI00300C4D95